jgi:hypothetical protein
MQRQALATLDNRPELDLAPFGLKFPPKITTERNFNFSGNECFKTVLKMQKKL